ncbi:nucleotidyltransferase family protein [Maribacter sp. 2307ULW6-5]|uniref:nucleotidyltransferase family protein n=1 Tax=Maribacter sp. 2307ULW6-5 TaxID=3386275 RepID=UPI0039BD80A5
MSKQRPIAALVMAAGQSQRMGAVKQLLPWKQSTLLGHTLKTLQENKTLRPYVVTGAHREQICDHLERLGIEVGTVHNPHWKKGLSSSIAAGIRYLYHRERHAFGGALVCLADQPLLTLAHYNGLLKEFQLGQLEVIATNYGGRAGVPAVFRPDQFQKLMHLEGDMGARALLNQKNNKMLELPAGASLMDIDTPEQYEALYQLHH